MSLALLFHYLLLNMFRMLVHPSSGACDLFTTTTTKIRGIMRQKPEAAPLWEPQISQNYVFLSHRRKFAFRRCTLMQKLQWVHIGRQTVRQISWDEQLDGPQGHFPQLLSYLSFSKHASCEVTSSNMQAYFVRIVAYCCPQCGMWHKVLLKFAAQPQRWHHPTARLPVRLEYNS